MNILKSVMAAGVLLVSLSGCGLFSSTSDGELIYGEALVDDISIEILESFPVQVRVVAMGNLQDACTEIHEIEQSRMGNTFDVTITTARPADLSCAQVLTPFEQVISLEVRGLPAETYTVNVNGVSDTFELQADNESAE